MCISAGSLFQLIRGLPKVNLVYIYIYCHYWIIYVTMATLCSYISSELHKISIRKIPVGSYPSAVQPFIIPAKKKKKTRYLKRYLCVQLDFSFIWWYNELQHMVFFFFFFFLLPLEIYSFESLVFWWIPVGGIITLFFYTFSLMVILLKIFL